MKYPEFNDLYKPLSKELIKYQEINYPDTSALNIFEFIVERGHLKVQKIDDIIANLKLFDPLSYSPLSISFLIRDQHKNKNLFRIYFSNEISFGWVLKNLMEEA